MLKCSLCPIQRQVFKNLSAVLEAAGSSLKNVVKVNVFLTTMDNFAAMNEAYDEFITSAPKPVRPEVSKHEMKRLKLTDMCSAVLALLLRNCLSAVMLKLSALRISMRHPQSSKSDRTRVSQQCQVAQSLWVLPCPTLFLTNVVPATSSLRTSSFKFRVQFLKNTVVIDLLKRAEHPNRDAEIRRELGPHCYSDVIYILIVLSNQPQLVKASCTL